MLSTQTLESARTWYETGVQRIQSESVGVALAHLDRAIAVFAEAEQPERLTHARHYRLLGLKLEQRFEEVEGAFAEVMQGYTALGDTYGQALLLCHLAEAQGAQGRWERAHSLFNLASLVAENDAHREVVTHVLRQQGQLCRARDNYTHALRLYQRAEKLVEKDDPPDELARFRFLRAQALATLGETAEAIALLEDVQAHHVRLHQSQTAMEPLSLLRQLYEDEGLPEERSRVTQLMHLSGQRMIQTDLLPRPVEHLGPPIDRSLRAAAPA
jgi:tetratricopeptide (TPR) repeat protein